MTIRIQGAPERGEKVLGPPKGWRPRPLKTAEKLQIVLNQNGLDPDTGKKLEAMGEAVEFDHDPAIHLRPWHAEAQDTDPPANDLRYIVARSKPSHKQKTNGNKATTYGSDKHAIAKLGRLTGETKQNKPKRQWPSRKMQSRKGFR